MACPTRSTPSYACGGHLSQSHRRSRPRLGCVAPNKLKMRCAWYTFSVYLYPALSLRKQMPKALTLNSSYCEAPTARALPEGHAAHAAPTRPPQGAPERRLAREALRRRGRIWAGKECGGGRGRAVRGGERRGPRPRPLPPPRPSIGGSGGPSRTGPRHPLAGRRGSGASMKSGRAGRGWGLAREAGLEGKGSSRRISIGK